MSQREDDPTRREIDISDRGPLDPLRWIIVFLAMIIVLMVIVKF